MSVLRLSCIRDALYVPDPAGDLDEVDYSSTRKSGMLAKLPRPPVENESNVRNARIETWLDDALPDATAQLGAEQPVVVMVHGFLFDPRQIARKKPEDTDNPHGRVYHFKDLDEAEEIRHHTTSWPLGLGFKEKDRGRNGLVVAFGWHSQPGFAQSLLTRFQNFYARAYDYATETAWPLACVLSALAKRLPDRQIDIFCHSLGSRVVVRALAMMAKNESKSPPLTAARRIGRVIILGGSEYTGEANLMYKRIAEAAVNLWKISDEDGPQFFNIVSRENDVLDTLAENFGPKSFFSDTQVIGHNGLMAKRRSPRWIDLQIDGQKLRQWAADQRGLDISGDQPGTVWDHWYYFTFRGNMKLYRGILRDRANYSMLALRQQDIPEGVHHSFFGD